MTKWTILTVTTLLFLGAFTGCISADYVGQSFPEMAPGTLIAYFDAEQELPEDTYKMIGQVRLRGRDSYAQSDFRAKLLDIAEEHGADAVKVTRDARELAGSVTDSVGNSNYEPSSVSNFAGNGFDGPQIGSFGAPLPGRKTKVKRYETVIDAKLLVRTKRFDAIMAQRRAERELALNPPPPAPPESTITKTAPEMPEKATPEVVPAETVPEAAAVSEAQ